MTFSAVPIFLIKATFVRECSCPEIHFVISAQKGASIKETGAYREAGLRLCNKLQTDTGGANDLEPKVTQEGLPKQKYGL